MFVIRNKMKKPHVKQGNRGITQEFLLEFPHTPEGIGT